MNKEEFESKQNTTKKTDPYEEHHKEVLKDLEKKHGKKWIKENWEMLEKDRKYFKSLNLL